MLISPMGGCEQEVTFLIMQHDQSATPQDFPCAPDQPTWNQRIGMDGLAVSINIEDMNWVLSSLWPWFPQRSGPACERFSQERIGSNGGQLRQKSFGMAVAVGPMPTSEQCQSLATVAPQIPGSSQSDGLQEQECEQETTQGCRLTSGNTQR